MVPSDQGTDVKPRSVPPLRRPLPQKPHAHPDGGRGGHPSRAQVLAEPLGVPCWVSLEPQETVPPQEARGRLHGRGMVARGVGLPRVCCLAPYDLPGAFIPVQTP